MIPLLSKTLTIPSLPLLRLTLTPHSLLTRFTSTPTPTQTRSMSSDSTQRVFQLKLDPLTGNSEWVIIEDGNKEEEETFKSSSHALLATTSYLDMLNDDTRNRAFREAIDKTITKPCHVLDIGYIKYFKLHLQLLLLLIYNVYGGRAGTGLLSMMAARAMGTCDDNKKGMVTACESYLPMVKLMRKVLNLNGMGKNVKIFNKRSDELQVGIDIPSRADVLVSIVIRILRTHSFLLGCYNACLLGKVV